MANLIVGNVQKDHEIVAQSELIPAVNFTINASADANASISPSGAVLVAQGASQSFSATPNDGFRIVGWLVDGVLVPVNADGSDVTVSD